MHYNSDYNIAYLGRCVSPVTQSEATLVKFDLYYYCNTTSSWLVCVPNCDRSHRNICIRDGHLKAHFRQNLMRDAEPLHQIALERAVRHGLMPPFNEFNGYEPAEALEGVDYEKFCYATRPA